MKQSEEFLRQSFSHQIDQNHNGEQMRNLNRYRYLRQVVLIALLGISTVFNAPKESQPTHDPHLSGFPGKVGELLNPQHTSPLGAETQPGNSTPIEAMKDAADQLSTEALLKEVLENYHVLPPGALLSGGLGSTR